MVKVGGFLIAPVGSRVSCFLILCNMKLGSCQLYSVMINTELHSVGKTAEDFNS